jgi:hypothetical protein
MHTRHSLGLLIVSSLCAGLPLSAGYPLQPGLAAAPGTNAVTPLSLVDTADLIAQPDVTFNWRRHEFFTVFAADHVIYARRFQATGSALGGRITLSPLNGWHLHPRVAYNVDIDRYLVVWEETEGPDDWVSIIWARLLDSTGAPLGARFRLSDTANFFGTANGVQPDVAARNFHHALEPNETAFVVTWREWFTGGFLRWITAERIDMNGVELESIVVGLPEDDTIPLPPDEQDNEEWREADVAYSPHFDRFLIVWNEDGVHARTLSAGGSPGPVVSLDAPTGRLVSMAYDMGSRKFLVGWCHDGQLYGDIVTAYVTPTNLGAFDMGSGCFPNLGAEPGGFLALHSGPDAAGDWGIARSYVSDTGSVWPSAMFGHDPDFSYSESTVATGQQGFSFGSWDAIDGSEPDRPRSQRQLRRLPQRRPLRLPPERLELARSDQREGSHRCRGSNRRHSRADGPRGQRHRGRRRVASTRRHVQHPQHDDPGHGDGPPGQRRRHPDAGRLFRRPGRRLRRVPADRRPMVDPGRRHGRGAIVWLGRGWRRADARRL